ncbi:MAG TPA: extracellular solute-binding protein [Anaerolineales bacterium]|nr:extracellular solute-binding protein [Anaerolineales bacterium]
MKKLFPLFIIVSILLSACGAVEQPATSTEEATTGQGTQEAAPSEEPSVEATTKLDVNIDALRGQEVRVWTPWYGVEQSLFESFVNEFNSSNPYGIKVSAESQSNFTNVYEITTAALPTENKPDLVIALPEHAQGWYQDQVSIDLTDYAEDPVYGLDESDIPYAIWNQDIAGTARVAVPAQRTARVMLWNETWANELKIKSAPVSVDDFRKQACNAHTSMKKDAFAENDAMGGWIVDTEPMTVYSWLLAFHGGVLEGDNYRFLAPNNIDAFKYLRELAEAGCSWQGSSDPITSFAKREALFITVSLSDLPTVARAFVAAENRDTWKVLPFPNGEDGVIAVYGSSYVIFQSTEEKQMAAWLFVRWLLEKEQDARWVEATHNFPLHTSTVDLLGDYEKNHAQWRQAVELLPLGELQPQLGSWRTIKLVLGDGFDHIYRVNVSSGQVAAILAQMESLAKDLNK